MPQPALRPPASGVTVRMYRHGLGDCLLLAFASNQEGRAYYVMIDCGVMAGTKDASEVMNRVVRDVIDATGGELHVLAISHEHWDHISGFTQAKEAFQGLKVHNLWLSWTEDPADEQAARLRARFEKHLKHLALAFNNKMRLSPFREQLAALLGFYDSADSGPAGFSPRTREAMDDVISLAPDEKRRFYHETGGRPLALPSVNGLAVPGVSVYVMAPSRDETYMGRLEGSETYEEAGGLAPIMAFSMGLRERPSASDEDYEAWELSMPFRENLRIAPEKAAGHPFFQAHYGFGEDDSAWRRIDHDWLDMAGELAIQADRFTNNTSLVLAFCLDGSDRVLLFTGDAQVGNWLSWGDASWTIDKGGSRTTVGAKELLERTVFYKVGHHGSHNATIRERKGKAWGLELMTSPELVAMVPTDEEMAHSKKWFRMPFDPLLRRLDQKTRGRTVRADTGLTGIRPNALSESEWEAFKSSFQQQRLYLQFTIPDGGPSSSTAEAIRRTSSTAQRRPPS